MSAIISEDPKIRNRSGVFEDRNEAGEILARSLESFRGKNAVVLAIPFPRHRSEMSIARFISCEVRMMIGESLWHHLKYGLL